jgi:1-acyl-sn-glycerol-3-phosphate acyltransferase
VFAGRTGYAALAIEAGVPVVPVVSIGGHETLLVLSDGAALARRVGFLRKRRLTTCPVILSLPWGLTVGPTLNVPLPSRIVVRVLDPVPTAGRGVQAVDQDVRGSLQAALDELAAQRRVPLWG